MGFLQTTVAAPATADFLAAVGSPILIDASGGPVIATLPALGHDRGAAVRLVRIDDGTAGHPVTVAAHAGDTIAGSASIALGGATAILLQPGDRHTWAAPVVRSAAPAGQAVVVDAAGGWAAPALSAADLATLRAILPLLGTDNGGATLTVTAGAADVTALAVTAAGTGVGIDVETAAGTGIYALVNDATSTRAAIYGENDSPGGIGVQGKAPATDGVGTLTQGVQLLFTGPVPTADPPYTEGVVETGFLFWDAADHKLKLKLHTGTVKVLAFEA